MDMSRVSLIVTTKHDKDKILIPWHNISKITKGIITTKEIYGQPADEIYQIDIIPVTLEVFYPCGTSEEFRDHLRGIIEIEGENNEDQKA